MMVMSPDREKNIALAQQIAEYGNFAETYAAVLEEALAWAESEAEE